MRKTLKILNELEQDQLLLRYAIGGAVGAIFYAEVIETEDLDVLILLPRDVAPLAPLGAIYEELRGRGYLEDGPYVIVEGVPVQFLIAYNKLVEEAVEQAHEVPYEDITTRIATVEHLLAMMVQTGRAKDKARFNMMMDSVSMDTERLEDIILRHELVERFRQWTST